MTSRLKTLIGVAAAGALLALPTAAQAAPPPNDAFGEGLPIALDEEINSTNLEATGQTDEPEPTGSTEANQCSTPDEAPLCASSVWYRFTAPEAVEYTIETCDRGTDLDTLLGVYTGGSIGSLVKVGSNDDACAGGYSNNGSRVSFTAVAGTDYAVDITGYHADRGSFYLRIYEGGARTYIGPDTGIDRENSLPGEEIQAFAGFPGVLSGPRHSASFSLIGTQAGSVFECALDGGAFSSCTSPVSYDDLASGSTHQFRARAIDAGGFADPTPVIERFTIDTQPPNTEFTAGPPAETASTSLNWEFASSEPNLQSEPFFCGLDSAPSEGCSPPLGFEEFCQGVHELRAAAWDAAANIDPTPATLSTKVTGGTPCTAPDLATPISGPTDATRAAIDVAYHDHGAGGRMSLQYGTTSAYGLAVRPRRVSPSGTTENAEFHLEALQPATTYHYRIELTTPFGTVSSADATFTTEALAGQTLATIVNGAPRVVGLHAAEIPFTLDNHGLDTEWSVLISRGATTDLSSAFLEGENDVDSAEAGAQARSIELVDLDPGTYRFRVLAYQDGPVDTSVFGPEGSFKVPADPAVQPIKGKPTAAAPFRLKRKNVKLGKLRRSSTKLVAKLRGLPPKTKATLKIKVGKAKQTATKKADAKGKARFKITLSKRIRKALKDRKVKKATIKVTATPPGQKPSSVVFKQKLKP